MTTSPPPGNPETFRYELRIPKDRIAVLVGKDGDVKNRIESETKSKITIDSQEGDVFVEGKDVVLLVVARDIVHAIGRGFNPEIALLLLQQDYLFELITLQDYSRHKNHQIRMKGRVIGKEGRSRELIEEYCQCHLSVYGKTVGIVGEAERCATAKRAVEMLLDGSPHASVYKWLEKKRKQIIQADLAGHDVASEVKDDFKKYVE